MATVGLILVVLIPILLLILVGAQIRFESLSTVQASSAARIASDSINEVWVEGPHASKQVLVNLPSNTRSVVFRENEVVLTLQSQAGDTQVSYNFFGELAEPSPNLGLADDVYLNITGKRGLTALSFRADSTGRVVISYE